MENESISHQGRIVEIKQMGKIESAL